MENLEERALPFLDMIIFSSLNCIVKKRQFILKCFGFPRTPLIIAIIIIICVFWGIFIPYWLIPEYLNEMNIKIILRFALFYHCYRNVKAGKREIIQIKDKHKLQVSSFRILQQQEIFLFNQFDRCIFSFDILSLINQSVSYK